MVTDVAVLTIETIKVVFKSIILKQLHFLKSLDIFMTLLKFAKKVTLRDAKEYVDKVCIEVQKTSDNTSDFSLQYKTFSRALNYAQDFGTTVKQERIKGTEKASPIDTLFHR